MRLFYTPTITPTDTSLTLSEAESKHCIRVLRQKTGDKVVLIDGIGNWYNTEISDDNVKRCTVKVISVEKEVGKRNFNLHIAIAPTKNNDRTEWFIEKATEIGIDEISMINCKNAERKKVNIDRFNKIAVSAIKQSLKAFMPKVNDMASFDNLMRSTSNFDGEKFIAHCNEQNIGNETNHLSNLYTKGKNAIVLIGPEGDFTPNEVKLAFDNGFKAISLGKSRLRTETAALYACTVINVLNE